MATNIVLKRSASADAAPTTSDLELGELALNTYDGKIYMKKSVSGSESIVNLSGARAATSSAFSHTTYKYTASGSTTTFSGTDDDSKTLAYTAGQIQVFLNGILLDVSDYTASNGSSVVLGSATGSGSILYVISFEGTNPFDYFKYTATSGQTSFSGNDANSESLLYTVGNIAVYLNGVLLDATDYTATSGTTVVLASGATSGDILTVWEFNETGLSDLSTDTSPQLGGDLDVVTHDIVSTSNRHIDIVPHGTGNVTLQTDTVQLGSSAENVTVTTNSTGDLTLNTNSGTNSGSIVIADGANNNITLTPNGSGNIVLDNHTWPAADGSANQVLSTNGSGVLSFATISSNSISDDDGNTKIQVEEGSNDDTIRFDVAGTEQIVLVDGVLRPTTDNDIDLGTSSIEFKDAFFDGTVTSDAFAGPLTGDVTGDLSGTATLATSITVSANNSTDETVYPLFVDGATGTQGAESDTGLTYNPSSGTLTSSIFVGNITGNVTGDVTGDITGDVTGNVTGNTSGTAATVTTAAQTNITSLGTLTTLTVDNVIVNGTTIGHTSDTDLMTLTSGNLTVAGDVYIGDSNKELRFYEGSNYVGFEAPALSANQIWVLPTADGSANQTLKTDGSGTLSWATAASAVSNLTDVTLSSLASNEYLRYNGSAWVNTSQGSNPIVDTMTGDGSDTTLTLSQAPLHENATLLTIDGVVQHKSTYAVSGTTLTFSTAPPSGTAVECITNVNTNILNGNDVAVDTMTGDNSDTTLSLSVTPTNENHVNVYWDGVYQHKDNWSLSGTTITFATAPGTGVKVEAVSNQMMSAGTATGLAATAISGLTQVTAVAADHLLLYDATDGALKKALFSDALETATSISTSADSVALTFDSSENATFAGNIIKGNMTISGTEIDLSSGDLTLDVAGDIILDADGGDVILRDGGTSFGQFTKNAGNLEIYNPISDGDVNIIGNDGGSNITAVEFDMSNAGDATFNSHILIKDGKKIKAGNSQDLEIYHSGSHSHIHDTGSGNLYLDSDGTGIYLTYNANNENMATFTANGAVVLYHDNASRFATDAEGANVTGLLDVSSRILVAGGTEATSSTGAIRTEGGISAAKKIYGGSDLTVEADGAEIYLKSADYNIARIIPRGTSADLDKGLLSLFDAGTEDVRIDTAGASWFNGGNVLVGHTSTETNGKLQVTGGIGLKGNSEIRSSTNSDDGSTIKFFGTQMVAGSNSHTYGYSEGGYIASLATAGSAILLDVGNTTADTGHRFKVINAGNGIDGSMQYIDGTTVRFHVDSSTGVIKENDIPVRSRAIAMAMVFG